MAEYKEGSRDYGSTPWLRVLARSWVLKQEGSQFQRTCLTLECELV